MKVLLHICCGVCAAGAIKSLVSEGHEVIGYFYNPNIQPVEEYQKRFSSTCRVSREFYVPLEIGEYNPDYWLKQTEALKHEPEGGARCHDCYKIRLEKTYKYLFECEADAFTTSLTISPYKSSKLINEIGSKIGGERFLVRDFKKNDGFKDAIDMAKRWDLYRQDYCGCIYSVQYGGDENHG